MNDTTTGVAGTMTTQECVDALRAGRVARLGIVSEGSPVILPFSYSLVGSGGSVPGAELQGLRVLVHVTGDGAMSRASGRACLELDSVYEADGVAWSVVVLGGLRPAVDGEVPPGRGGPTTEWRAITIESITGRRFAARTEAVADGFSVEWEVVG